MLQTLRFALLGALLGLPMSPALAQAPASTPEMTAPAEEASGDPTGKASDEAGASAELMTESAPLSTSPLLDDPANAVGTALPGDAAAPVVNLWESPWVSLALVLAVLLAPIPVGNWLAEQFKMPDHAWKMSLVIGVIAACALACGLGEFKGGPDLVGGITLIYELENPDELLSEEEVKQAQAGAQPREGKRVEMNQLIDAIKQRVDPAGTKEVSVRQYGQAVEIIIPNQNAADLDYIKRLITNLGSLEFRILADPRWNADDRLIKQALLAGPTQKIVELGGVPAGKWVEYDVAEFGPPDAPDNSMVRRSAAGKAEALLKLDPWSVTGEYLERAYAGIDQTDGSPAVHFIFDDRGAKRFGRLTGENTPNASTQLKRRLGVLLDNRLRQAPSLNSKITDQGIISGMTGEEVDLTVGILNAGSLPAALNRTPISEAAISSTLGATTVEKGKLAIGISLAAVALFMLAYYRFAGVVACLSLSLNVAMVLAIMVIIKAAFTLPGLAGLALTVAMSVDANILVFERLREELSRGASLRMAIRNGFERATTTIIDSNFTNLITGAVLYAIGTDQVKGFAVTLIIGILASMFTAIFFSRLIFDLAERRRWITDLKFASIVGETKIDFIGWRNAAVLASLVLIGIGTAAAVMRGGQLLDIDFTGGSSVTMALDESSPAELAEVNKALEATELKDANLTVVELGDSKTRFTVTTSIDDPEKVKQLLAKTFPDRLKTFAVAAKPATAFTEGELDGAELAISFNDAPGFSKEDGLDHDSARARLQTAADTAGIKSLDPILTAEGYTPGSSQRFTTWTARLPGLTQEQADSVAKQLVSSMQGEPIFPLASKIGGKVAGDLRWTALQAMAVSLLAVVAYVWFRFQTLAHGLAAVVALVHDVLISVGALAVSYYMVGGAPAIASALGVDAFQIGLTVVAALLTIIGYSLNDTVVIYDRIREVRGKSPRLTADMINLSVNQTLSRTLLTSLITLIVVVVLYIAGGPGIHGFAFALVVGVIAGTYSTVFIASPLLLVLAGTEGEAPAKRETSSAA